MTTMVLCHAQALYKKFLADVIIDILTSEFTKGAYTRASCQIGLMHPFCHPQSKVGKLSSTKKYHVMFMNGPNEKRCCGYNNSFTDYEAVIEMVIGSLSATFPEKMVASVVPKCGALIVALACVEASGDIRLLSMCVSVWNESEKDHEVLCGLTLPHFPISSKSNKKLCLPGTQAT
jgi:hypothetical protein